MDYNSHKIVSKQQCQYQKHFRSIQKKSSKLILRFFCISFGPYTLSPKVMCSLEVFYLCDYVMNLKYNQFTFPFDSVLFLRFKTDICFYRLHLRRLKVVVLSSFFISLLSHLLLYTDIYVYMCIIIHVYHICDICVCF